VTSVRPAGERDRSNGTRPELGRTSLLREVYRSLLNTGRTYAGFRDEDREIVGHLAQRGPILDPMSGYGGLASFCSQMGADSFGVEYNPPQFFWQVLVQPDRIDLNLGAIEEIIKVRRKWPKPRRRAIISDEFVPDELRKTLISLFEVIASSFSKSLIADERVAEAALSLLLPFAGRLCCTSPADISTHTKEGGTCVLVGWQDDFATYLAALRYRLKQNKENARGGRQHVISGDARNVNLGSTRFRAMFTSPPYPNHRDFSSILLPENKVIDALSEAHGLPILFDREAIIGSNFVKGAPATEFDSIVVSKFINQISAVRRNKRAGYDDDVYYIPYFRKYFSALGGAYHNIARYLDSSLDGYIAVVNNTHRGVVIPVAETVREIWEGLGFHSEIHRSLEMFHLGARNPRAKGIRARHTEYLVRIWR
jgi:hypothetical protein